MEWAPDVSVGDWVKDALVDQQWATLRSFVPGGFEAYARVFHPFSRDRADGHDWRRVEEDFARGEYYELDVIEQDVSWAETAAAFGTVMHPLAQSHRLLGAEYGSSELRIDAAGWRYAAPREGELGTELLGRLATVLARSTLTPRSGFVGVWEGWGGLTSSAGVARVYAAPGRGVAARVFRIGMRLARPFMQARALRRATQAKPGSGVLAADAAAGPRLELPDRNYILFRAGIEDFQTDQWLRQAPWIDVEAGWSRQTPSLIWPQDRSWFLATEIDYDTTIIGGSAQLIAELVSSEGIEAARIGLDDDLTSGGDLINRPRAAD